MADELFARFDKDGFERAVADDGTLADSSLVEIVEQSDNLTFWGGVDVGGTTAEGGLFLYDQKRHILHQVVYGGLKHGYDKEKPDTHQPSFEKVQSVVFELREAARIISGKYGKEFSFKVGACVAGVVRDDEWDPTNMQGWKGDKDKLSLSDDLGVSKGLNDLESDSIKTSVVGPNFCETEGIPTRRRDGISRYFDVMVTFMAGTGMNDSPSYKGIAHKAEAGWVYCAGSTLEEKTVLERFGIAPALEDMMSARATQVYLNTLSHSEISSLLQRGKGIGIETLDDLTPVYLSGMANKGNEAAKKVFEAMGRNLGISLYNVFKLVSPDRIVLTQKIFRANYDIMKKSVRDAFEECMGGKIDDFGSWFDELVVVDNSTKSAVIGAAIAVSGDYEREQRKADFSARWPSHVNKISMTIGDDGISACYNAEEGHDIHTQHVDVGDMIYMEPMFIENDELPRVGEIVSLNGLIGFYEESYHDIDGGSIGERAAYVLANYSANRACRNAVNEWADALGRTMRTMALTYHSGSLNRVEVNIDLGVNGAGYDAAIAALMQTAPVCDRVSAAFLGENKVIAESLKDVKMSFQ